MRRGISFALTAALLVLLLFSVFAQVWVLPAEVEHLVVLFPEVEPLAAPSVIWGVIAIACWQAVAVMGVPLAIRARDRKLSPAAYGWLRAMVCCLLAFIVLVVAAFITLSVMEYATPGVMLGLIGGGLIALIVAVAVVFFLWTRPLARHYWHS